MDDHDPSYGGCKCNGLRLRAPTDPSLFKLLGFDKFDKAADGDGKSYPGTLTNVYADIRGLDTLKKTFEAAKPEIVIHMAAQPIVRTSYEDPVGTYATNVMGTVNVMECCRLTDGIRSVVNVTTDKVYRNLERREGYREEEELCGFDPYANSKSCSELVTSSYRNSFFKGQGVPVTTMRVGNVIGGGDFAKDHIIPDCVRAAIKGEDIIVRNPYSVRPYQHVLEPVVGYLRVAAGQYNDPQTEGCYNIGPNDEDAKTTGDITTLFCKCWNTLNINNNGKIDWVNRSDGGPHEDNYLKLDCTKIRETLDWHPVWNIEKAVEELVIWYGAYARGEDLTAVTKQQINEYLSY